MESKTKMRSVAILLAGGSGNRMKNATKDKILEEICGKSSIQRVLESFKSAKVVSSYIFVYKDLEQRECIEQIVQKCSIPTENIAYAVGGSERYLSVHNGLQAIPETTEWVWIHDCARSLIHKDSLIALKAPLEKHGASVLCHPVKDSIKRIKGSLLEDVKRDDLLAMETPQAFAYKDIFEAYNTAIKKGLEATDDIGIYEQTGKSVHPVINPYPNPKLTTPEDIHYFEFLLNRNTPES